MTMKTSRLDRIVRAQRIEEQRAMQTLNMAIVRQARVCGIASRLETISVGLAPLPGAISATVLQTRNSMAFRIAKAKSSISPAVCTTSADVDRHQEMAKIAKANVARAKKMVSSMIKDAEKQAERRADSARIPVCHTARKTGES